MIIVNVAIIIIIISVVVIIIIIINVMSAPIEVLLLEINHVLPHVLVPRI